MNIFILVILIILLLLFIIFITKLNIFISYYHNGDDDELMVRVRAWRILSYTFKAPLIKIDKDSPSIIVEEEQSIGGIEDEKKVKLTFERIMRDLEKFKDFLQQVVGFHKIVRRFLSHVSVRDMRWTTNIGVSDAALTGFLSGMAWSVKGGIIGLIANYTKMKQLPKIAINPHFQQTVSQTDLKCIVSFRVGYSIIAGILVLRHWKRRPVSLRANDEKA
ncbi:DUF2953 domain-containing protein [Alkalihalobacterium alkalinitrilicum]|uniref:DUF2953 domain-containing protein n=1 Tax=Alkalihalobacterium alkalinitrilicum TaxID=427920 RepID=UPI001C57468B|nr:DUF2953 domain-containing protein [Alkalihalobacterium alkalinitrilicum]